MLAPAADCVYDTDDPDARLMLRVAQDDVAAFEELVQRYQRRLGGMLQSVVRQSDQIEDLIQEIFMKVYRSRRRYEPSAKFSTWLYQIARNTAYNANRTLRRRHEIRASEFEDSSPSRSAMPEPRDPCPNPAERLDATERANRMQSAIAELTERHRRAIEMAYFECCSHEHIAAELSTSPPAVKSLLSRIRRRLRHQLQT